jgi:hypothetical protein
LPSLTLTRHQYDEPVVRLIVPGIVQLVAALATSPDWPMSVDASGVALLKTCAAYVVWACPTGSLYDQLTVRLPVVVPFGETGVGVGRWLV